MACLDGKIGRARRFHAGPFGDAVGGQPGVAVLRENVSGGLEDGLDRRTRRAWRGSFVGKSFDRLLFVTGVLNAS